MYSEYRLFIKTTDRLLQSTWISEDAVHPSIIAPITCALWTWCRKVHDWILSVYTSPVHPPSDRKWFCMLGRPGRLPSMAEKAATQWVLIRAKHMRWCGGVRMVHCVQSANSIGMHSHGATRIPFARYGWLDTKLINSSIGDEIKFLSHFYCSFENIFRSEFNCVTGERWPLKCQQKKLSCVVVFRIVLVFRSFIVCERAFICWTKVCAIFPCYVRSIWLSTVRRTLISHRISSLDDAIFSPSRFFLAQVFAVRYKDRIVLLYTSLRQYDCI